MKCEMIRDLLPLYIDGLTSEESNQQIEKHLKSCEECQLCYKEMTGDIGEIVPISESEVQEVDFLKKIKKKNRKKKICAFIGIALAVAALAGFIIWQSYGQAKYENVRLDYGVRGDAAYFTMESKPGYSLHFSGSTGEKGSKLKVWNVRKIGSSKKDKMRWENEMGTKDDPCRWVIEFKDKTIVIENGELIK